MPRFVRYATIHISLMVTTIDGFVLTARIFQTTAGTEYQHIAEICAYRRHLVGPWPVVNYGTKHSETAEMLN